MHELLWSCRNLELLNQKWRMMVNIFLSRNLQAGYILTLIYYYNDIERYLWGSRKCHEEMWQTSYLNGQLKIMERGFCCGIILSLFWIWADKYKLVIRFQD